MPPPPHPSPPHSPIEIGVDIAAPPADTSYQHETTQTQSERRHAASTAALCTCTFIQAYLLISVFPYAGFMVIDLIPGVDEESAGPFAGLIASSFMAGRTISAYPWGTLADTYGRKVALVASLVLSALVSVLFGLSKTFWWAVASRFFLGFSNGIQSTAKTTVTEIAHGDEKLEARGTGLAIGMRGVGFLLSPALGGILAEPVKQFPESRVVKQFQPFLARFPFLLPNLVGAALCVLSAFAVCMSVEETLPREKRRDFKYACRGFCKRYAYCFNQSYTDKNESKDAEGQLLIVPKLHSSNDDDSNGDANGHGSKVETTMASIWKRKSTRKHLVSYWLFSFVVVCVDEAFPLYCISKDGGLSLTEASIGKILSAAGLIFVLGQYYVFATMVEKVGLYRSLTLGTLLGVPLMAFIPIANVLNDGSDSGELQWTAFVFLALLIGIGKIFCCLFFAGIVMATNRTVPASLRATTNGLSMVGGSVSKGLGPTFAGLLVAFSMTSGIVSPQYGAIVVWSVIALLGLLVVKDTSSLQGEQEDRQEAV